MKKLLICLLLSNLSFSYTLLDSEAELFEKYDFICEKKGRKIIPVMDLFDGGYKVGKCYKQEFDAPNNKNQTLTFKVLSNYPYGRSENRSCLFLDSFYIMNEVAFSEEKPSPTGKILLEARLNKIESTELKYPGKSIFLFLVNTFGRPGCAEIINMDPDATEADILSCFKKEIEAQKEWHSNFNINDFRNTSTTLSAFETLLLGKDKFKAVIHVNTARAPEVDCPDDLKDEKAIFSPPSP